MKKWRQISSKIIFVHPRISLIEDQVEVPSGRVLPYLRFGNHKSAVTVLAIRDGEVLVQREYSYPTDKFMVQFPGGAIEQGESPEGAANRELAEESGFIAGKLELLGAYYMDHRKSNAKMYVLLATGLKQTGKNDVVGEDPYEFIESFWMRLSKLPKEITSGKIDNSTAISAWAFYEARYAGKL